MPKLGHNDFLYLLFQLCLILVVARSFGEIFKRLRQPAIVGELLGGIILGPSVLGQWYPDLFDNLFLSHPSATIAMDGVYSISIVMLLFISGMEIDLPLIWKNGRSALFISITGMIIPLSIGTYVAWKYYDIFSGGVAEQQLVFALFMGTVLSITALPVIAKILIDLNLLNSKIGSLIVTCAMLDDFVGWILFSIVLSLMPGTSMRPVQMSLLSTIFLTIVFVALTLTVIKALLNRLLAFLSERMAGPGGAVTIAMAMCFAGAIFTEYIGIHAVFGAFLMGIAFSESHHFTIRSKEIIHQFVANIFAPLFFVSIGLKVDFVHHFDATLLMIVLLLAFVTKISGGFIGGKLGRLTTKESLAVGFGINARGAMGIILSVLGLDAGLINENMFVALTLMSIITSLTSGNFIRYFLKDKKD